MLSQHDQLGSRRPKRHLDPQYAKAYNNRGIAYQKLGQTKRANQDYDEAIRLDPSLKRPYQCFGKRNH